MSDNVFIFDDIFIFSVHQDVVVRGLDCGAKVGEWLSRFLKQPGYRLLYLSPSVEKRAIRNATVKYAAWTSHVDSDDKVNQ